MIKKTNGHEAEDETGVVPVPEILMQHNEHQKDDENDRFVHYVKMLTGSLTNAFHLSNPFYRSELSFFFRATHGLLVNVKPTTTLATSTSPDGETIILQEHDGHHFLKIGGVPLMSTTAASSEQTMAELACEPSEKAQRVLIGGLGFGFTLRKVLELVSVDSEIVVAELLQELIDWNRDYLGEVNGRLLDDSRVSVQLKDVFKIMQGGERYDVILLDVDNSPDPLVQKGNARLYQRRGLEIARAALRPRGRVVYWSAHPDPGFVKSLKQVFSKVEAIPAKAYPKAKRYTHTLFLALR